jgi:hypothetical protein
MTEVRWLEDRVLFSPDVPEAVNQLLQAGVLANHADKPRAEQLFKQAQALDATCLQTYFALYKFYFYQGRLREAEREVLAGLHAAAELGGFHSDYTLLAAQGADMYTGDNALFYMYTLKALAFIKLRLDENAEAENILAILRQLDPEDRSGASVIMQLAQALQED